MCRNTVLRAWSGTDTTHPNPERKRRANLRCAGLCHGSAHRRRAACLPAEQIAAMRRVLGGETLVAPGDVFKIERSLPHGPQRGKTPEQGE